ncbi:hypothetical protein MAM1_0281c09184 [Mucor ambiguus]|uniref:Uncharacterized protein n=1 Tax=Mucor ambiguus TaxID=91626 RepID=A0A0C9N4Z6_9FUNG|nr:hypothetical protein MAM1_0281c09184 [Mucor ambiguus]
MLELLTLIYLALTILDPTEGSLSTKSTETSNEQVNKLELEQFVLNADQFIPSIESVRNRLEVLEDILCSSQRSLTESQAIAKINDLVETTKNMESALTNLQEKYIGIQAKQNNYNTIIANMNRFKKHQQRLGSRLELLEEKGKQDDGNGGGAAEQSLESRIILIEDALFSVQAFQPNELLKKDIKELSEKNKALEINIKFLQKKLAETHANQAVLRVDLDSLNRRTVSNTEDLVDCRVNKPTTKTLDLKKETGSIILCKKDVNQEQSDMNGRVPPHSII